MPEVPQQAAAEVFREAPGAIERMLEVAPIIAYVLVGVVVIRYAIVPLVKAWPRKG